MGIKRFNTIITRIATTVAHTNDAKFQRQLVMDNKHVTKRYFIKIHDRPGCPAGIVVKGGWLSQQHRLASNGSTGGGGVQLGLGGKLGAVRAGQRIQALPTNIVPRAGVLAARVALGQDNLHPPSVA